VTRGEDYVKDLHHFVRRSSMPNLQTLEKGELQRLRDSEPEEFHKVLRAPFLVNDTGEAVALQLPAVLEATEVDASAPVEAHGEWDIEWNYQ
jgi:hypothetical protein